MQLRTLLISATIFVGLTVPGYADGVTAWCGNGCSTEEDGGTSCTDWTQGSGSAQVCQAHAICSSECTTWPTSQNASIDVSSILRHDQARRLSGARTFQMRTPPRH